MTKSKRRLMLISLEMLAVLVALVAGEVVVRLTRPLIIMDDFVKYEPALFSRTVLRQEERTALGMSGEVYLINSLGYRGENFSVEKPPGVTRIVIMGGSSVFDLDASGDQDWPHRG